MKKDEVLQTITVVVLIGLLISSVGYFVLLQDTSLQLREKNAEINVLTAELNDLKDDHEAVSIRYVDLFEEYNVVQQDYEVCYYDYYLPNGGP